MTQVTKFLCCIRLEVGGLIMGWMTLLLSVLFMTYTGAVLIMLMAFHRNGSTQVLDVQNLMTDIYTFLVWTFGIGLIYHFILCIASIMLIFGTIKRNHKLLLPLIFLLYPGIFLYIVLIVAFNGTRGIIFSGIMLLVSIYFLICVTSLYNKLKEAKMLQPFTQSYPQPVIHVSPYQPGAQNGQAASQTVYPAMIQWSSANQPRPSAPG